MNSPSANPGCCWQPISTAPKNGREVQIWTPRDGWIPRAYYGDGGWISVSQKWTGDQPKAWMPTPSDPECY